MKSLLWLSFNHLSYENFQEARNLAVHHIWILVQDGVQKGCS